MALLPAIVLASTFTQLPIHLVVLIAVMCACAGLGVLVLAESQSNYRLEEEQLSRANTAVELKTEIKKLAKTNERYESLMEATTDAVIVVDGEGKILEANATFAELLGYGPKGLMGHFLPDLAPAPERAMIKNFVKSALNDGTATTKDLMLTNQAGTSSWFEGCATSVDKNSGAFAQVVLKDITESKRQFIMTEKEISFIHELSRTLPLLQDFDQMLERILSMLSEALPFEGFALVLAEPNDTKATICVSKKTSTSFLEDMKSCVKDVLFELGDNIDPSTYEFEVEHNESIAGADNVVGSQIMLPLAVVNGLAGLFSSKENAFKKEDLSLFSTMVSGISSLYIAYKSYQQVQHMSVTDSLTGLYNRRKFFEEIEREIERVSRYDSPLSLIMLDVDHFKNVNDQFGHQMGDEVLRELAKIILDNTRKTDIVARYGGEEFIIMLTETPVKGAVQVAKRIRKAVESTPVLGAAVEIKFTASMGVSTFFDGDTTDALVQRADEALYAAKDNGRNRVELANITPEAV